MPRTVTARGAVSQTFRDNLRRLRRVKGMSQRQLGAAFSAHREMDHSTISLIENARRMVTIEDLVIFAEIFSVRPEELLVSYVCASCNGLPPSGFTCNTCGQQAASAPKKGCSE